MIEIQELKNLGFYEVATNLWTHKRHKGIFVLYDLTADCRAWADRNSKLWFDGDHNSTEDFVKKFWEWEKAQ